MSLKTTDEDLARGIVDYLYEKTNGFDDTATTLNNIKSYVINFKENNYDITDPCTSNNI